MEKGSHRLPFFILFICRRNSNRFHSGFTSTDTDDLFDVLHENFSVADFSGTCRFQDGFDSQIKHAVVDDDLDFHFWQEIDHVFGTPIEFGMAFLGGRIPSLPLRSGR